ncbi:hypothetical protein MPTK2_3g16440 [Marchantia polymorpha subsp. ruderalis]
MASKATILIVALLGLCLILADARCTNSDCDPGKIKSVTDGGDDNGLTCLRDETTGCNASQHPPCCEGYCEKRVFYGHPYTICTKCLYAQSPYMCEQASKHE